MSRRYIEYSTATREAINSKTDEFIETQLLQIEANIDSLQDIIDQQREKSEVIDLTRNEQAYFQELVQLETNQEKLRVNLRSLAPSRITSAGAWRTPVFHRQPSYPRMPSPLTK